MENVSVMVPGIQLGPYHLTDLEYADDAAIFATNQNDISSALAIFDAERCKLGLRTSWAKTKNHEIWRYSISTITTYLQQ